MYQLLGLLIIFYSSFGEQIPGLAAFAARPADNERERTILVGRMPAPLPQQTSFYRALACSRSEKKTRIGKPLPVLVPLLELLNIRTSRF